MCTYEELVRQLQKLVLEKQTVTMYIKTDRLVMITVNYGEIVAMKYGMFSGWKALELLSNMNDGTYKVIEDGLSLSKGDLPDTEEILIKLIDNIVKPHDSENSTSELAETHTILYSAARVIVIDSLAAYIGATAEKVVDEAINLGDKPLGLANWCQFVRLLSKAISDDSQSEKFIETTIRTLELL